MPRSLRDALLAHAHDPAIGKPRLKIFRAGRNRIENDGARYLAGAFKALGSLQVVSLPQNTIRSKGIARLVEGLKANPRLVHLGLQDNIVSSEGGKAIAAAIPFWPALAKLNLMNCVLGSDAAVEIADALAGCARLEQLDLGYNELSDMAAISVAKAMHGKRKLRFLGLNGNSISRSTRAQIASQMKLSSLDKALGSLSDNESSDSNIEDTDLHGLDQTSRSSVSIISSPDLRASGLRNEDSPLILPLPAIESVESSPMPEMRAILRPFQSRDLATPEQQAQQSTEILQYSDPEPVAEEGEKDEAVAASGVGTDFAVTYEANAQLDNVPAESTFILEEGDEKKEELSTSAVALRPDVESDQETGIAKPYLELRPEGSENLALNGTLDPSKSSGEAASQELDDDRSNELDDYGGHSSYSKFSSEAGDDNSDAFPTATSNDDLLARTDSADSAVVVSFGSKNADESIAPSHRSIASPEPVLEAITDAVSSDTEPPYHDIAGSVEGRAVQNVQDRSEASVNEDRDSMEGGDVSLDEGSALPMVDDGRNPILVVKDADVAKDIVDSSNAVHVAAVHSATESEPEGDAVVIQQVDSALVDSATRPSEMDNAPAAVEGIQLDQEVSSGEDHASHGPFEETAETVADTARDSDEAPKPVEQHDDVGTSTFTTFEDSVPTSSGMGAENEELHEIELSGHMDIQGKSKEVALSDDSSASDGDSPPKSSGNKQVVVEPLLQEEHQPTPDADSDMARREQAAAVEEPVAEVGATRASVEPDEAAVALKLVEPDASLDAIVSSATVSREDTEKPLAAESAEENVSVAVAATEDDLVHVEPLPARSSVVVRPSSRAREGDDESDASTGDIESVELNSGDDFDQKIVVKVPSRTASAADVQDVQSNDEEAPASSARGMTDTTGAAGEDHSSVADKEEATMSAPERVTSETTLIQDLLTSANEDAHPEGNEAVEKETAVEDVVHDTQVLGGSPALVVGKRMSPSPSDAEEQSEAQKDEAVHSSIDNLVSPLADALIVDAQPMVVSTNEEPVEQPVVGAHLLDQSDQDLMSPNEEPVVDVETNELRNTESAEYLLGKSDKHGESDMDFQANSSYESEIESEEEHSANPPYLPSETQAQQGRAETPKPEFAQQPAVEAHPTLLMATKPVMPQESPNVPSLESPPPFEPLDVGSAPVSRFTADNFNETRSSAVSTSFDSAPRTSKAPSRVTPTVVEGADSDMERDVDDAHHVGSYQRFSDAEHESENEAPSRMPLKKGKAKKERSKPKRVDGGNRDADLKRERAGGSHSDAGTASDLEQPSDQLYQAPVKPEPSEEGIVPLNMGSHETLEVERPPEAYSHLEQEQEQQHELDEGYGSHPRVVRQKLDKRESISDRIVVTLPAQLQAAAERTGSTEEFAEVAAEEGPEEFGAREAAQVEMQVREEDALIMESPQENSREQALEEVILQPVLSEVEEFRPETGGDAGPPGSPKLPAPGLNNRGELVLLDDELAVLRMQQEYSGSESDESVYDGEDFFIYKLPKMRTTARRIEEPLLVRKRKKHVRETSAHLEEVESV